MCADARKLLEHKPRQEVAVAIREFLLEHAGDQIEEAIVFGLQGIKTADALADWFRGLPRELPPPNKWGDMLVDMNILERYAPD
jgi:hypothetical protein